MTKEEKELLLKDLCARVPYHPKINIYNDSWEGCQIGEFDNELWCHHIEAFNCNRIEIKPYLRPMSSIWETEEERKEYVKECNKVLLMRYNAKNHYPVTDWLLEHHFDFRGLIEKGLALEAPEGMYEINKKEINTATKEEQI